MSSIRTVIHLHTKDRFYWFIAPCIFELAAFLISLGIDLLYVRQGRGFTSGESGNIFALYFALGIISVNDTFRFALGFGVRRKEYVLGTLLLVTVMSAAIALVLVTLGFIEAHIIHNWGVGLHLFLLPYLSVGALPQQVWVIFSLLVHLFSLGFVIGSIYQRFGNVGLLTLLAVAFTLLATGIYLNSWLNHWGAFFAWFGQHTAFELTLWLLPLTALYLLTAYLLLRRAVA